MPETTAVEAPKAATPEKKAEESKAATDTPKSSPTKGNPTLAEAFQLLASGKRNLLVNDVAAAVDALATCCQLFGEVYGEGAVECSEAYFVYGKSLLELSRLENGVLENGLEGVPDEDTEDSSAEDDQAEKPKDDSMIGNPDKCTDEEKKEIVEEVGKALEENAKDLEEKLEAKKKAEEEEAAKKKAEEAKTNGDATDGQCASKVNGDSKDEKKETNGHAETNGTTNGHKNDDKENADEEDKENAEEDSQDENESQDGQESIGSNEAGSSAKKDGADKSEVEKEDEDEPSNLQLAWEILELAKVCYTKHAASLADDDSKRLEVENKLSETYQLLGEASIENEDYQKACEDLTSCLKRRQELMPEDSRCIAETHYQLGVALGFNLEFDKSVTSFNDAIAVLEKRIANLKEKKESKDPSSTNDAFYTREREIAEIEKLLPEIKEKIADTRDLEKETSKKLGDKVIGATEGENGAASAFKSPEKAAEENGASSSSSAKGKSPAVTNGKATSDIQMMVKKRKKSDAEEKKENGESSNGTSSAKNGDENGKSEEPSTKKAHIEQPEPEAAKSS